MSVIYEIKDLVKKGKPFLPCVPSADQEEILFNGLNIKITEGELVVFYGTNAAGKSTMFNILIGEEKPDAGSLLYRSEDIFSFSGRKLMEYRRQLGLIFQDLKLIDRRSVKDNVAMIPFSQGLLPQEVWKRTYNILKNMGLLDYQYLFPKDISSGTRQRLAIARALVNDPLVIIADEPTGNVDSAMEREIFEMLSAENSRGKTVIIFTSKKYILDLLPARIMELK